MKNRIVWVVLSCLMVVVLVLASCGPAAVEEEEAVADEVTEEEVPAEEGPTYGGTITFARATAINAFDEGYGFPWNTVALSFTNEELFGGDWGKGLQGTKEVTWQTAGFSGLVGHEGRLCESYEVIDNKTLIYHIRKGVYWHDKPPVNGREFDATDVLYNFERGLRLDRSYLNITMTQEERPVSMEVLDKWTIKVVMPPGKAGKWLEQSGELMNLMPREVDEEWGDMNEWTRVIGTGPFTIKDFVADDHLTLQRYPDYWRNDPVHPENQLPYVDEVIVQIITDPSTRIAALRTGKLDVLGLSFDDAEDIIETVLDLEYVEVPGTTPPTLHMDLRVAPFNDIRVRQALQIGLDQKVMCDSLYGGHGEWYGFPLLNLPEHADMWWDLEELPQSTQELFGYDLDKAKQLLADAGYPNGFKTTVLLYNTPQYVDQLTIVKDYWSKIGVELELDVKDWSVYNSQITSKTYDGLAIRSLSGSSTTHKLYTYRGGETGPVENLSFVDDPLMDDTYTEMLDNYFDKPTFRGLFKELVPYIMDKVWMIQLTEVNGFTFWWPWLKGYTGEMCVGYYDIYNWPIYTWIDQDLKKEMGH